MARRILLASVLLFIITSYAMISCVDSDFQDVAQEWANIIANRYGNSVKFVDLKAERPEMKEYLWAHTEYNYLSTILEDPGKLPQNGQAEMFEQWFSNGGSVDSTTVFTREVLSENTFSIQFTESFKYGMSAEASISIPATGGAKFSESFEFNLSSNQAFTKKVTKKWSIQQTIKIPPKKSVLLKFILQTDVYQDFWVNSEIELKGFVAIWFNNKIDLNHDPMHQVDLHWLWFVPVETIVSGMGKKNYTFNSDGNPVYVARGKISGNNGLKSYVTIEEHDIVVKENAITIEEHDLVVKENDIKFLE